MNSTATYTAKSLTPYNMAESPMEEGRRLEKTTVQVGPDPDLEKEAGSPPNPSSENGITQKAKDPNLVEFDGPDDPGNPQNFPKSKKWLITVVYSSLTMWVQFSSSVFSTASGVTSEEFHVSTEVMTLGTSLPVLGFAFGPLIWGPMSELYGRYKPLFIGYTIFTIFQIPVAVSQNLQTIFICRFFQGFFGCSTLAIIVGGMADFWGPVDRAVAISFLTAATFVGPIFGPIIGGFIVDSYLGWRWTAWITLIPSAFFGVIALFIVPETYGPVLLQQRATRLRKETRNWAYHSLLDENPPTMHDIFVKYLARPVTMLVLEPILLCITIYISLIYGILYLFFEAFPISFTEVRGWKSLGVAGLPFLGILIGVIIGCIFVTLATRIHFARQLEQKGKVVPEDRLPPMMIASVFLPIGLFWFAWTSSPGISWVPQVIASVPIGFAIPVIWMQGLNYLIDVYLMFANSAISGNTLMRSMIGAAFPMFAQAMYDRLGVDWATSVLGFLGVAMAGIPAVFYFYGAKIRAASRYSPKL